MSLVGLGRTRLGVPTARACQTESNYMGTKLYALE